MAEEARAQPNAEQGGSSFSRLYELHAARGLRFARSLLGNEADAQEAVQEAFCRLLAPARSGAAPTRSFGAAFYRVLRNHAIDLLRRRRHRAHVTLSTIAEPAAPECSPFAHMEPAEERLRARLASAFAGLPENQREALRLRLEARLSYDEIAVVLGATRGQIRTWIHRARQALARTLANGEAASGVRPAAIARRAHLESP